MKRPERTLRVTDPPFFDPTPVRGRSSVLAWVAVAGAALLLVVLILGAV